MSPVETELAPAVVPKTHAAILGHGLESASVTFGSEGESFFFFFGYRTSVA